MAKTEMLYMQDNYLKKFSARIISTGENYVVLNQTAFYPLGGGQESDTGIMLHQGRTFTITSVRRESGDVRHFFTETEGIPKKDEIVECELDWEKRFTHMRYHSAIHVFSRYMQLEYKADVVGNNISIRSGRADFHLENSLTQEDLQKIEDAVNNLIEQNFPININFMPREEAIKFLNEKGYQTDYIDMVPPSVKIFRIISVGEYDYASCAGTHVSNTSEIGRIKIVKRRSMGVGKERITLTLEQ
ncbi:MAG TPA: alanyl-tRNA editing protein [candidate division Zixibacteria bacterium]|nr:alanyl-tRNA editing protein [candidate division Zixibacteria bacterium]